MYASIDEVRAAYREMAKIHHPDVGGTEFKFLLIKQAYNELSDPAKKEEHDKELKKHPFNGDDYFVITYDSLSVKKDVYDDLKSVFTRKLGSKGKLKLQVKLLLHNYDLQNGTNVEVEIPIKMICEKCFGFGGTILSQCSNCKGTGRITEVRKGHFRIPGGTKENEQFVSSKDGFEVTGVVELNTMELK